MCVATWSQSIGLHTTTHPLQPKPQPQGRPFLLTAYNREGDSHRSPWSNAYHPPLPEDEEAPYYPPEALRDLEREANELWDIYLELYYGGSGGGEVVGSVYLWDQGSGGDGGGGNGEFAGCFAVKKRE